MSNSYTEVRTGASAVDNGKAISVSNGDVFYICGFTNDVECYYIEDVSYLARILSIPITVATPTPIAYFHSVQSAPGRVPKGH